MALTVSLLDALAQVFERLPRDRRRAVLALGYPDMLAPINVIDELFGGSFGDRVSYREDGAEIAAWHGLSDKLSRVVETASFFDCLDADLSVIDIVASRGTEEIVDLNEEMPEKFREKFDVVIDPGTIEHCFNIAQAMRGAASSVRPGGYIVHFNPMNMYNHGFYNLNPTFYADFYHANGFRLIGLVGISGPAADQKPFDLDHTRRFTDVPKNANNLVIAERETAQPIVWPMQSKYRDNPDLKG